MPVLCSALLCSDGIVPVYHYGNTSLLDLAPQSAQQLSRKLRSGKEFQVHSCCRCHSFEHTYGIRVVADGCLSNNSCTWPALPTQVLQTYLRHPRSDCSCLMLPIKSFAKHMFLCDICHVAWALLIIISPHTLTSNPHKPCYTVCHVLQPWASCTAAWACPFPARSLCSW